MLNTVPYPQLSSTHPYPITLCEGLVDASIQLSSPGCCLLSVPNPLFFSGSKRQATFEFRAGDTIRVEYRDRVSLLHVTSAFLNDD